MRNKHTLVKTDSDGKFVLKRKIKSTLTPFVLNHNQTIDFILRNGSRWQMTLADVQRSKKEVSLNSKQR